MIAPDSSVLFLVVTAVVVGLATAAYFASRIALISIEDRTDGVNARLINHGQSSDDSGAMSVPEIARAISEGANAFLYAEYQVGGAAVKDIFFF